jgi:ABC-type glutathione transport system ATPase component
MTIVGVYDLREPDAEKGEVFITRPKAQSLYNLRDQVTEVALHLDRVDQEAAVVAALRAALPQYEVDSWETLRPEMRETLNTKSAFTSFFGIVVVLVASIGILNLMLMAVFERTREMGVLAALGLSDRAAHRLDQMSGGEQQRVAIARALATRPTLVLADEPTANLDTANGERAMEIMRHLNETTGTAFLFATHDPRVVAFARRVVTLRDGKIVDG